MRLPRVTYANVTSTLALFLSLGGVSWAAATLPRNSVGSAQIKAGAVTPAKLSSAAIRKLAGAPGPEGQAGPQGDRGPAGSSATVDAQLQSTIDAQKTQIQTLNATVTDLRDRDRGPHPARHRSRDRRECRRHHGDDRLRSGHDPDRQGQHELLEDQLRGHPAQRAQRRRRRARGGAQPRARRIPADAPSNASTISC